MTLREFSAPAGDQSSRGKAGIGEWRGVGDYRAGDVRRSDRVINSVRVVAGRVCPDRQRCWNRRRRERRWDGGWDGCWDGGWYQAGRARGHQSGEQNLFFFILRKRIGKINKNGEILETKLPIELSTYQEFHGEHN